ncbi:uncharacterized protein LOC135436572 isoform X1 [Drosophila montana]|uniref:uncharacterized protein LOC135436572 isoform X1 n=2 Tax=Drosophila montana TaxID=40370 RepID=UPI00313A86C1
MLQHKMYCDDLETLKPQHFTLGWRNCNRLQEQRLPKDLITGLIRRHLMGGGLAYITFHWGLSGSCWAQFTQRLRCAQLPKMSTLILLLLLLLAASSADMQQDAEDDYEAQPENFDGRSFFFLGTLFRRWRDRWLAFQNPAPLYAGAAFPLNGYFNCPSYGCNPAAIGPQPGGFYPAYYVSPLQQQQQQQQQQQAQGNSNVYIYQTDQNTGSSVASPPYGPGFFGPARQPTPLAPPAPRPLPLPPPAMLPPATPPPQASASSFGFGAGPVPVPGCGPNPMACALG